MTRSDIDALAENAACKDADPELFRHVAPAIAELALAYCDRCTVVRECELQVNPRWSLYDGVAAGKVWEDGRIRKMERGK